MGGVYVERQGENGPTLVRGKRRTSDKGYEAFHEDTGWVRGVGPGRVKQLREELKRKRNLSTRLAVLQGIEDMNALSELAKESSVISKAVEERKKELELAFSPVSRETKRNLGGSDG